MARKPATDSTPRPRASRGKSGKPPAPPAETAVEHARHTAVSARRRRRRSCRARPPAARRLTTPIAPHPPRSCARSPDPRTSRPAALTRCSPGPRALRARPRAARRQPMIANHPLVSGGMAAFMPHRPRAAGEVRRRHRVHARLRVRAQGRPAASHRRAGGRRRPHERDQVLLGVTGSGKTFTMAQVIAAHTAAGADPGAEQDAGGPALRRVQELLPRQRGRVLRLLLRLLPARSLRAAHRHLHREGKVDERADRPHAPRRHALAAGARRCDHRAPACRASTASARSRPTPR